MNQIVYVKNQNNSKGNNQKKKFIFKAQFIFSLTFLFISVALFIYFYTQDSSDNYASQLSNNYQVYRLYSNNAEITEHQNDYTISSSIIGTLEIPTLNISYPILSDLTENLLKISPCRFYGDISDNSNLCIAGHNFDNDKFFGKIRYLNKDDQINITDNNNVTYPYFVFANYEVDPSDLSPIYNTENNSQKELTLVTCNNQNNKRIIVKAQLAG